MGNHVSPSSGRNILALTTIAVGVLLLLVVPVWLLALAFQHDPAARLPGTLVIITSVGGMVLVVFGIMMRKG